MLSQIEAGAFTPDLSRLADLVDRDAECFMNLNEVSLGAGPLVLQLDKQSPESTLGAVHFEAILDEHLGFIKASHPHEHHDSFELDLPLDVGLLSDAPHDLECSLVFADHLEVLGVVEQSRRNLLHRHLHARTLDTEAGNVSLTLVLHDPRGHQPNLPLNTVWAVERDLT